MGQFPHKLINVIIKEWVIYLQSGNWIKGVI